MNVFLYELKSYRKTLTIWTCCIAAVAIMYICIFSAMLSEIQSFKVIIGDMPEVIRRALSIYVDSIANLNGFYSFVFSYIVLCGAIQAMNLGTSIVSKEVREKTADFLLTKPMTRQKVLTSKILAVLTMLLITNIVYIILVVPVALSVKSAFDMKIFLMISFTLFFVQVMFAAMGILVSVIFNKIKSVVSVALTTVFGFFIVGMFGTIIGDNAMRYISPFKYFDEQYIIKNASYEPTFVIIETIFIIVSIFMSYLVYAKKDIHAV